MIDVPVLIAGGGPVGLTASFLLSRLGIKLAAGRAPSRHRHPSQGARHQCPHHGDLPPAGHRGRVRKAGLPPESVGLIVWTRTLSGEEIERRVPFGQSARRAEITPVRACLCAQDYLEPVLRRCAERQPPGELRFNTELTSFEQDGSASSPRSRHGDGRHAKRCARST